MAQAASQRGIAVERAKVAEQLARAGEQDRVPLDQRLVGDVLRQGRFADAVGTDDDDIGGLLEEVERHQRLDGGAVAALGPVPVEVAQRLEAADMSGLQPPFQAAACALPLFPIEQRRDPGLGRDLRPVRHQAVQMQRLGAGAQGVEVSHRNAP